jgi:hypothetical protein
MQRSLLSRKIRFDQREWQITLQSDLPAVSPLIRHALQQHREHKPGVVVDQAAAVAGTADASAVLGLLKNRSEESFSQATNRRAQQSSLHASLLPSTATVMEDEIWQNDASLVGQSTDRSNTPAKAMPAAKRARGQSCVCSNASMLTRAESFHELLPRYRREGKHHHELFWGHSWWVCGGSKTHKRAASSTPQQQRHHRHELPGHVQAKKIGFSFLLLLNTIYVSLLFKEVFLQIAAGRMFGLDGDSEGDDDRTGDHLDTAIIWRRVAAGLVATIPPVLFLFFVVPHALLDFVTATSVEQFIAHEAIQQVRRSQIQRRQSLIPSTS